VPPPPPPTAKYVRFIRFIDVEIVQVELHTKYVYVPEVMVDVGEIEKLILAGKAGLSNENPSNPILLTLFIFILISPKSVVAARLLMAVTPVDGL
jgi:hypothetical protein